MDQTVLHASLSVSYSTRRFDAKVIPEFEPEDRLVTQYVPRSPVPMSERGQLHSDIGTSFEPVRTLDRLFQMSFRQVLCQDVSTNQSEIGTD
jgi:hypothetical protein